MFVDTIKTQFPGEKSMQCKAVKSCYLYMLSGLPDSHTSWIFFLKMGHIVHKMKFHAWDKELPRDVQVHSYVVKITNVKSRNSKWAEQRSIIMSTFLLKSTGIMRIPEVLRSLNKEKYSRIMKVRWNPYYDIFQTCSTVSINWGNLFKTQILEFHPKLSELVAPGEGPNNLYFQK